MFIGIGIVFRVLVFLLLFASLPGIAGEKLPVFAGITHGLHHLENDIPKGTATAAVVALMDATGLPYEILMMNWAQAQRQTLHTPNSLLFAFARSPEREERFQWLVPLGKLNLKIARLTSRPELVINKFEDLAGYKVAAVRTLSTHNMLTRAGITESEQLLLVDSSERLVKVIENHIVDFVFYDAGVTPAILKKFDYPMDFLTPTEIEVPWAELWLYLAANKQLSADIKTHIITTHERLVAEDSEYRQLLHNVLNSTGS